MEKIISGNNLIAIKIKKIKNGIVSLTDPDQPLQLVSHKRSSGESTKPHIHAPKTRITGKLQECLVVMEGKIKIDFYTPDKKYFKSIYLSSGEAVVFISGGHGVHMLRDSAFIEIKNGPFTEDKIFI